MSVDQAQQGSEPGNSTHGSERASARARLHRLKINRFRRVRPGTELRFDEGINVLLGRNGTGKTTLLNLLVAVATGDLRAYEQEPFDLEFDLTLADERISIAVINEIVERRGISVRLGDEDGGMSWHYRIRFDRPSGDTHDIEIQNGRVRAHRGPRAPGAAPLQEIDTRLFVPDFYTECLKAVLGIGSLDFPGFVWVHRLLANNCLRLDEGLDIFRAMTDGDPLPRLERPLRMMLFAGFPWGNPEDSARVLLELPSSYVPRPLIHCLVEHGDEAHRVTELSVFSESWSLLRDLEALLRVARVQVSMSLADRRSDGGPEQTVSTFAKPVFRFTTKGGTTYTHDRLSYGEKRLLTFLYHAAANPEILVADELVNGLHHEWIQACLDAIGGQAFLTSQNPLLLDHLAFSSAEEAQRRFVQCSSDDEGAWGWRNMDLDEAEAFYRAYEVGVQHVSDILRTKGLW